MKSLQEIITMKTIISGDITIYEPTEEVRNWVEENLTLTNPLYLNLRKRGKAEDIERKHIPEKVKCFTKKRGAYIVPFGCLRALWPMISKGEYELQFAEEHQSLFAFLPSAVNLFDYQKRGVEELYKAKGGLLKAGCGSGKTYMGIELLRRIGKRFLWLCGQSSLLNQTKNNIKALYPDLDIGTITDGEVNMGSDGTIATVQTMVNVDYRLYENEFNAVIVDECHRIVANPQTRQMYATVLGRCKARYKYGLTATPKRQDGLVKMIYAYVGLSPNATFRPTCVIKDSETQSLIASYKTFNLNTPESYDYLGADGVIDYHALLEYLQTNEERTRRIASEVKNLVLKDKRKVALLTYRKDHVYALQGVLSEIGIKAVAVTGETKKAYRNDVLDNPDSWDVIVSTVHLFKEGLDIKALDTVFIGLPFKDDIAIQQSEGRAERPLEGKNDPLFIFAYDKNIPYCESVEKKMRRIVNRRRT